MVGKPGTKNLCHIFFVNRPFMAALTLQPMNKFFCGGNIITASHVLTAAHCIENKYKKTFKAENIAVLLGRHNISRDEIGSEIRGVREIQVHPRWNSRHPKFEGDIAILELDRAVQFSDLIRPICLTVEPEISRNEAGYVVTRRFRRFGTLSSKKIPIFRLDGERVRHWRCTNMSRGRF